jgi:CheY-like chemotaxis protein
MHSSNISIDVPHVKAGQSWSTAHLLSDDKHSRRIMQLLLMSEIGYQRVTIFEHSSDFLNRVKAPDPAPELIFLDIHVTPHDGFEMLRMLRSTPSFEHTRIVALTASVMNEEVQSLQDAGFDGCIAKPLNIALFPQQIREIMRGEPIWSIAG